MAEKQPDQLTESLQQALTAIARQGGNLDELIPRELAKNAKLFNVDAVTRVNLFGITALYLPVAVADAPAGRRTVYKLPVGEKTLMGLYIVQNRIFKDFYTRTGEREYAVSKESDPRRCSRPRSNISWRTDQSVTCTSTDK